MSIEKAKSTLVHYFRTVFEETGLKWDGDNVTEVEGIVDDIAADLRKYRGPGLAGNRVSPGLPDAR